MKNKNVFNDPSNTTKIAKLSIYIFLIAIIIFFSHDCLTIRDREKVSMNCFNNCNANLFTFNHPTITIPANSHYDYICEGYNFVDEDRIYTNIDVIGNNRIAMNFGFSTNLQNFVPFVYSGNYTNEYTSIGNLNVTSLYLNTDPYAPAIRVHNRENFPIEIRMSAIIINDGYVMYADCDRRMLQNAQSNQL